MQCSSRVLRGNDPAAIITGLLVFTCKYKRIFYHNNQKVFHHWMQDQRGLGSFKILVLLQGEDQRMVVAALVLWVADVVCHTVYYKKLADRKGNSFSLYGMVMAMIASGLLTYVIGANSKHNYVHYVNGIRLSEGVGVTLETFMCWVFIGAAMNLLAMGLGYLLTKKYRAK